MSTWVGHNLDWHRIQSMDLDDLMAKEEEWPRVCERLLPMGVPLGRLVAEGSTEDVHGRTVRYRTCASAGRAPGPAPATLAGLSTHTDGRTRMWQLLVELLVQPQLYSGVVRFVRDPESVPHEFVLADPRQLAHLWALRKGARVVGEPDSVYRALHYYKALDMLCKRARANHWSLGPRVVRLLQAPEHAGRTDWTGVQPEGQWRYTHLTQTKRAAHRARREQAVLESVDEQPGPSEPAVVDDNDEHIDVDRA